MNILTGFNGIPQVDGWAGYDALGEPRRLGGTPLTLAYCWAHARRRLQHITQTDGSQIAADGLRRITQINKPILNILGKYTRSSARRTPRCSQSAIRPADRRLPQMADPGIIIVAQILLQG